MPHLRKTSFILEMVSTIIFLPLVLFILFSLFLVYLPSVVSSPWFHAMAIATILYWLCVFASSFFLGRMHCSHTCPGTGLFVIISLLVRDDAIMKYRFPRIIPHIFNILWLGSCLFAFAMATLAKLLGTPALLGYARPQVLIYYSLFGLAFILNNSFAKVETSHGNCPLSPYIVSGMRLSRILRIKSRRLEFDPNKCTHCGLCARHCLVKRDLPADFDKLPALQEVCANCGNCAISCKLDAVRFRFLP